MKKSHAHPPLRALSLLGSLAAVTLVASQASAQVTSEVSVQRFDVAPGTRNFITTRTARTDGRMAWSAGLMANYGYKPFSVKTCSSLPCDEATVVTDVLVVENMVTADAYGSLTIIPQLQVGLRVPVTWVKGQGIDDNGRALRDGINAVGLGDIYLEVKGRFYGEASSPLTVGGYAYFGAPTGSATAKGKYIGNESISAGGSVIADLVLGDFTAGANLGAVYRGEAQIGPGTSVGPELRWSAGVGYQVGPLVRVIGDAFGSMGFDFGRDLGSHAIEVDGGAQLRPIGSPFTITAGGGAGVLQGVGVPTARAFLGILYSADKRDRDGDGLADDLDACPEEAEDLDGFEDSDGCADTDNDQDSIPDELDKCDDKAEDMDSFEDADGCPEVDNDKDGVPDPQDMCPNEPETVNGFDDTDGCPDQKDTDKDGVPDDLDKCIGEAEDTDGFQDTDGCPDPDNDGDGVPDASDECIDQPEDGKGKGAEKTDGCPQDA